MPIRRLLIANRGEIVVRIARSARSLGIVPVGVASTVDREAPHLDACDAAVPLPAQDLAGGYLSVASLLRAAELAEADAVHPGYGFLSENADFAQAVIDSGRTWVGPPPAAMRVLGDKAQARRFALREQVPVLPGYDGDAQDDDTLRRAAGSLGFPLMVKAAAGGGGRGLRRVDDAKALAVALHSARQEALAAFGDGRLLLERAVTAPRHVEVQVLADVHGHVVHLGERDCSVQRRHQKLVEEAPSPAVDATLRRALGDAAVRLAKAAGYVGLGTVEFLLDVEGRFWFIEVNPRLQVEHPVTELLTGLDLVAWQLRVARGERLPWDTEALLERYERGGHAIEVRLCAEDPAQDFLPQAGTLLRWHPPPDLRCDHALRDGLSVSPLHDSMLAKLVSVQADRAQAAGHLAAALDRTLCLGVPTNRAFLADLLRHPGFLSGDVHTGFIDQHFGGSDRRSPGPPSWLEALAAAAVALEPPRTLPAMWVGWQPDRPPPRTVTLRVRDEDRRFTVAGSAIACEVRRDDGPVHRIEALQVDALGGLVADVDGRRRRVQRASDGELHHWQCEGDELRFEDRRLAARRRAQVRDDAAPLVTAPMHGRVVLCLVRPGDPVTAGQRLLVLEAMKMEHAIHAPCDAVVREVWVAVPQSVARGAPLIELTPTAAPGPLRTTSP